MIDTRRTLTGCHHVIGSDYIRTGRAICGASLGIRAVASLRAASYQELLIHAGHTPSGLCKRCERKVREA